MSEVSPWVARFAGLIPRGEVLDLACGSGRHARLLAACGHEVIALDRDAALLATLDGQAGIRTFAHDLEQGSAWPFAPGRFSGIVVTNYLHRPLLPDLFAGVAPGGVLIYETFAEGNQHFGRPSRSEFLLRPGELLDAVRAQHGTDWRVLAFEEGFVSRPKAAMVQRLCAVRGSGDDVPERLRLA